MSKSDNVLAGSVANLKPGSLFAGYRIEGLIDRGGMGVIYKATDLELDRTVALKLIAPEQIHDPVAVARFKDEARLAASLHHPNIVTIYRGGEYHGALYLAMRYVRGTTLRDVIRQGPMDLAEVARLIRDIAGALDATHASGLVHRDVKPANILVTGDGGKRHAYLSDFGVTKRVSAPGDLTRTGTWVGTPDYLAPEQIQDDQVDARTDVYSLGCVFHEMLTGAVPYPKREYARKLFAHMKEPPPRPRAFRPELVESFDEVVAKAAAKEPVDRYASAGELADAVEAALVHQQELSQETVERPAGTTTREDASGRNGSRAEPPAAALSNEAPTRAESAAGSVVTVAPAAGPATTPRRRSTRRGSRVAAGLILLAGVSTAALVAAFGLPAIGGSPDRPTGPPVERWPTALQPVPTNHVDGAGDAEIRLNGTVATVTVQTTGLLDGAPHAMHIHADGLGRCPPPSVARRHNGRRAISSTDAVPFFGRPLTSLTTRGDTGVDSILALNRFPVEGSIRYRRTIDVGGAVAGFIRQGNATVVIHGIDHNRNGRYDSVLHDKANRGIAGEGTAPAVCGALRSARVERASDGETLVHQKSRQEKTEIFVAHIDTPAEVRAPQLLCPLHRSTTTL
jgi:serine/threonine-protein kinase